MEKICLLLEAKVVYLRPFYPIYHYTHFENKI